MPRRTDISAIVVASAALLAASGCGQAPAEPRPQDSYYLFEKFVGMMR